MSSFLNPTTIAALVAAIASLVVVTINYRATVRISRRQDEIERMKGDVQAQLSERNALTAYQFEARKRLYDECEPAFFQLREAADDGLRVIFNLCDPVFQKKLAPTRKNQVPGDPWMLNESSAMIYALFGLTRPMAIYTLIRDRMTNVDVSLDPSIAFRYHLSRQLLKTYYEDARIAQLGTPLDYDPLVGDWRRLRLKNPREHWWQGTSPGRLDNALQLLIEGEGDGRRVITFGTFEQLYSQTYASEDWQAQKRLSMIANPLYGFSPETRPVFWRMLLIKAYLYAALVRPMPPHIGNIVTSREELADFLGRTLVACPHFKAAMSQDRCWSAGEQEAMLAYLVDQLVMPAEVEHK